MKIYNGLTGEVLYEKTIEAHGGYSARRIAKEEAFSLYEGKDNIRISSTMIGNKTGQTHADYSARFRDKK